MRANLGGGCRCRYIEFRTDSSGISILLKGRRAADRTGVAYRITGATEMVRQILSLTGVLEHLTAEPTADPPG